MNNKKMILTLVIRLFFYGYFTVWSLSFLSFNAVKGHNYSFQNDEVYLLSSQDSASIFKFIEENRRINYSGEHNSVFYFSPEYLYASGAHFFKLSGSFHFISLYTIPSFTDVNSSVDHSRPPPELNIPS